MRSIAKCRPPEILLNGCRGRTTWRFDAFRGDPSRVAGRQNAAVQTIRGGLLRTNRLEAFSDGVLAIVITIMVLELKAPDKLTVEELLRDVPVLMSYLLSFVMVAIVWVNHHHVFQFTERVDTRVLWLNNHLLLWVSLTPFVTAVVGKNSEVPLAAALYGGVMFGSAFAFALLRHAIASQGAGAAQIARLHRRAHVRNAIGVVAYLASVLSRKLLA
jgi:uncharacterized membrane protein